jgi:nitroreductase
MSEAAHRAPSMSLRELVRVYRLHGKDFGQAVALSAFAQTRAETERLFSAYDEDYHISRFFHFSEGEGERFSINGFAATHVAIDAEIETIL